MPQMRFGGSRPSRQGYLVEATGPVSTWIGLTAAVPDWSWNTKLTAMQIIAQNA
jgi:hypothetical protein